MPRLPVDREGELWDDVEGVTFTLESIGLAELLHEFGRRGPEFGAEGIRIHDSKPERAATGVRVEVVRFGNRGCRVGQLGWEPAALNSSIGTRRRGCRVAGARDVVTRTKENGRDCAKRAAPEMTFLYFLHVGHTVNGLRH
jgi:hypothetical protein